ncbi:MAG: hypothetical protein GF320_01230 [Armatimonadia bacterium]|nr:hypothetical protein [Armatimonadia bacterium]
MGSDECKSGDARHEELEERLAAATQRLRRLSHSWEVTRVGLPLLAQAREALDQKQPDHTEAEQAIVRLDVLLARGEASDHAARVQAPGLLAYAFTWAIAAFAAGTAVTWWLDDPQLADLWPILALAALAGAMGGAAQCVFGIRKYITERSFDPEMKLVYLAKPAMGLIMGPVVVVIFLSGALIFQGGDLASVFGSPDGGSDGTGPTGPTVPQMSFILLLGFLAGYSERFWVELIDQTLGALLRREDKDPERAPLD